MRAVRGAEPAPPTRVGRRDLDRLFRPQSVAVVGAADTARIGGRILANLRRHGFGGRVFAVDRGGRRVEGAVTVPGIGELPITPDVAVLAVAAARCPEALDALGRLGTRNAVVLASGFEESAEGGADLAAALRTVVARHAINLVGPNSQGLWCLPANLVLAFGSETAREVMVRGPVAVVADSGSAAGAVATRLQDTAVGISHLVSAGNQTGLCLADYLEHLVEGGEVRVVAAHVEGVREGARLLAALRQAAERDVAIVALCGGVGSRGRQVARSHTGRMLGSGRVAADVLRQHGAIVVTSLRDLTEACRLLALCPRRLPPAPRVGMVGVSGGMLALMSDACEARGVDLAELAASTTARLGALLPQFATPVNPVDVTGGVLEQPGLLDDTAEAVLADPGVDVLALGLDNRGYDRMPRLGERLAGMVRRHSRPVLTVLWQAPGQRDWPVERALAEHGVLVVEEPADLGARISWMIRRPPPPPGGPVGWDGPVVLSPEKLSEWDVQCRVLTSLGLPAPPSVVLDSPAALTEEGLRALGSPVVVKPVPNAVAHKTDRGLVVTGLLGLPAVLDAVAAVRRRLTARAPLLVQAQVDGRELLLSARQDPDWGPLLTLAAGGTLTELLGDSVSLSIPCGGEEVAAALAALRVGALLQGHRGRPPADIDALVAGALRLEGFLTAHRGVLTEVELNPVIVGARGEGAHAVDLLAH